jgi:hypothetical protein
MSVLTAAVTSAVPGRLLAAPLITAPGDAANRRFSLVYKGHTIGRHVVRSGPAIEGVGVSTDVDVTVKRLFLTMFSYSHRSEERWRDGRLMALKSETTEGGVTFRVDGAVVARGVVRAAVPVLQIVGVLPDIAAEEPRCPVHQHAVLVG